jgi:hypothetical protein
MGKIFRFLFSIVLTSLVLICFNISVFGVKNNQFNIIDNNQNGISYIELAKMQITENDKQDDIKDSIKSLRETYPEYFIHKIDTFYQITCKATLAGILATEKCRQSYIFLFNIISETSDTVVLKHSAIYIEMWADYDADYFMKYMGVDDFGDGSHTCSNAWDYIPSKDIKLQLKIVPNNKLGHYNLLDATLIK